MAVMCIRNRWQSVKSIQLLGLLASATSVVPLTRLHLQVVSVRKYK